MREADARCRCSAVLLSEPAAHPDILFLGTNCLQALVASLHGREDGAACRMTDASTALQRTCHSLLACVRSQLRASHQAGQGAGPAGAGLQQLARGAAQLLGPLLTQAGLTQQAHFAGEASTEHGQGFGGLQAGLYAGSDDGVQGPCTQQGPAAAFGGPAAGSCPATSGSSTASSAQLLQLLLQLSVAAPSSSLRAACLQAAWACAAAHPAALRQQAGIPCVLLMQLEGASADDDPAMR